MTAPVLTDGIVVLDGHTPADVEGGPTRAFALRVGDALAGGCELRLRDDGAEMSYYVFPQFRRRGFATRAVELACEYAFRDIGLAWVELHIEADNTGSLGVARAAAFHETGTVVEGGRELFVLRRQKPEMPFGVPLPVGPS